MVKLVSTTNNIYIGQIYKKIKTKHGKIIFISPTFLIENSLFNKLNNLIKEGDVI